MKTDNLIEFIDEREAKKLTRYMIKKRLAAIALDNIKHGIVPEINSDYTCGTCKSKDGASHPVTSYCFYCRTDNWNEKT